MRKIITIIAIAVSLFSCINSPKVSVKHSGTRTDSSYATYRLGNSLEAYTSKVYISYLDTTLKAWNQDSSRREMVDTTIVIYWIPRLDTAFRNQQKRDSVIRDSSGKPRTVIGLAALDPKYILKDYKAQ